MNIMKKQTTKDKDFRDVVGNLAGIYYSREEGFNPMAADQNGWTRKLKDAGVPFNTAVGWIQEATEAGHRCNCPLAKDNLVSIRFEEWLTSK